MKTIDDVLGDKGELPKKEKSSSIFRLGPKSDSDIAREDLEFKKEALEKRICGRCLIQSDGKIERQVPGEFCEFCGTKWEGGK